MITVKKIFIGRVVSEWKYQIEVWKTVVDWVVALYIILPFLYIFLDTYLTWWKQVPLFLSSIPIEIVLSIILLYAWSGILRIFIEDADQLFLFQQRIWFNRVIKYSVIYLIIVNILVTCIFFLFLAPFLLLHYGFSLGSLAWLAFFTFGLKTSLSIVKQLIETRFQGLTQRLIKFVVFIITGTYLRVSTDFLFSRIDLFVGAVLLLLLSLTLLIHKRVNLRGSFFQDVSRERDARLRFVNVLLGQAGIAAKQRKTIRNRPLLFRNSKLLFGKRNPVNALIELSFKSFLRSSENLKFYLQVVGACILMMSVFPSIWKWVLWLAFIPLLIAVVRLYWLESANSSFVSLFPWDSEVKIKASGHAMFLMALPGQIVLFLALVVQTQMKLEEFLLLPVGFLLGYLTAKVLSRFPM